MDHRYFSFSACGALYLILARQIATSARNDTVRTRASFIKGTLPLFGDVSILSGKDAVTERSARNTFLFFGTVQFTISSRCARAGELLRYASSATSLSKHSGPTTNQPRMPQVRVRVVGPKTISTSGKKSKNPFTCNCRDTKPHFIETSFYASTSACLRKFACAGRSTPADVYERDRPRQYFEE